MDSDKQKIIRLLNSSDKANQKLGLQLEEISDVDLFNFWYELRLEAKQVFEECMDGSSERIDKLNKSQLLSFRDTIIFSHINTDPLIPFGIRVLQIQSFFYNIIMHNEK